MESIHTEREAKKQLADRLLALEAQVSGSPTVRKLELDRLLSQVCFIPLSSTERRQCFPEWSAVGLAARIIQHCRNCITDHIYYLLSYSRQDKR